MSGYGMGGYVGSGEDARRIRKQTEQREAQRKKAEDEKAKLDEAASAAALRQFGTGQAEALENAFKNETVGLVTKAEFMSRRSTLAERLGEETRRAKREAEDSASLEREQRAAQKAKLQLKAKLSFAEDDEDEDEEKSEHGAADRDGTGAAQADSAPAQPMAAAQPGVGGDREPSAAPAKGKLGKDPGVRTDFLPDARRAAAEEELRAQLKREYTLRQQLVKNEPLDITYSYWDGSGHRRKITVRKGDTISDFLRAVRDQLSPDFRELRGVGASDLLYVKEDIILPHSQSFYDLIVNQARGKSGPLFHFDVHEDVRLVNDASREKDESHAGKVVERHWYNRNKHIFPASRWEQFDAATVYETYTIHGSEIH